MGYTSRLGRRPNEYASKSAHGHVVQDAAVQKILAQRQASGLDSNLCLLLFVDDPAAPRARIRLADLVRQRGERPLNLSRSPGQGLRLVLVDPAGAWKQTAPAIEVTLVWEDGY